MYAGNLANLEEVEQVSPGAIGEDYAMFLIIAIFSIFISNENRVRNSKKS
jgi:hypothetical protein